MKKYAIIIDENNDKRVVPTKWLTDNKSTLLWPPYKHTEKIRKAISQLEDPSGDWEEYPVKFIKGKDDYIEAVADIKANLDELSGGSDVEKMKKSRARRKKKSIEDLDDYNEAVAEAEITVNSDELSGGSDVETMKVSKTRRNKTFFEDFNRRIPQTIESTSSDTDENDETLKNTYENRPISMEILPPSLSLLSNNSPEELPDHSKDTNSQRDDTMNRIGLVDTKRPESEKDLLISMNGMLKKILTSVHALNLKQERLERQLRQLECQGINNTNASSFIRVNDNIVKRFPLDTKEKLDAMENDLKKRNIFNDVVHFMKNKGGSSERDLTYNILGSVITNDLATKYSFYGQKKKEKFQELILCSCIFLAVRTLYEKATDVEIITSMRMWLDNSKTRAERNKKNASNRRQQFSLVLPDANPGEEN